jgi:hypothetical protein
VALAAEDTNHDGVLAAADANFNNLRVWVDANTNGKADAGELKTLTELGVVSMDLHATVGTTVENGNAHGLVSSYTTADGSSHEVVDVWLSKQSVTAAPDIDVSAVLADPGQIAGLDNLGSNQTPDEGAIQSDTVMASAEPLTDAATQQTFSFETVTVNTDPLKNLLDEQHKNILL